MRNFLFAAMLLMMSATMTIPAGAQVSKESYKYGGGALAYTKLDTVNTGHTTDTFTFSLTSYANSLTLQYSDSTMAPSSTPPFFAKSYIKVWATIDQQKLDWVTLYTDSASTLTAGAKDVYQHVINTYAGNPESNYMLVYYLNGNGQSRWRSQVLKR